MLKSIGQAGGSPLDQSKGSPEQRNSQTEGRAAPYRSHASVTSCLAVLIISLASYRAVAPPPPAAKMITASART